MKANLSIPLYLNEAAMAAKASYPIGKDKIINRIVTDSKEAGPGDLFVALKGERHTGENFVSDAIAKGALCLTTQNIKSHLCVNDTVSALQAIASYYKTKLKSLKGTVAITGSVGKTTTKDFLKIIVSGKYKTHATYNNYNNHLGVPLTILSAPSDCEALILEMGMNHKGEIAALSKCAKPDIGVITNIGTAHIGNLGSRAEIAKAKLEIICGMDDPKLIIPFNEPQLSIPYKSLKFSVQNQLADIYIIYNVEKSFLSLCGELVEIDFKPQGEHMLECLCAAVGAAALLNIESSTIKYQISQISDKITRQTPKRIENFYIIPDYYNASLESISSSLKLLNSLPDFTSRSALIGTVRELGNLSEEIHEKIGYLCAESKISKLFIFGEYAENIYDGAIRAGFDPRNIFINDDEKMPEITADQILKHTNEGEIILFKASNKTDLGRIVDLLLIKAAKGEEENCS